MTERSTSAPEASSDALRRALGAVKDMKERLERAEGAAHEPIAVIGASCRLPGGADSLAAYWELLSSGTDAVGFVPADRWDSGALYDSDPDAPGKIYTDQGGFVDWPVDGFDAGFFGIASREANSLDPQHRLLLEVAWEALENAGVAPDQLAGSATGVFVGLGTSDYANLQVRGGDPVDIGAYFGTGIAPCVAAGRISHLLGLRGPALTLDTACSSSLVAIVLAVQSLRSGSCRSAIAGGVNLMLDPQPSIYLSRFRALSPTGRCHTFSADADGYVRGEGCGLVVLKRLSDAQADGDRIMAVIRGAAINHDGRSSGLTVPSGAAQREVMEQALSDAGLAPQDIDLIEAHGTGTELGDPIEIRALDSVYGRDRTVDSPLLIGSAKTNIGHLEAAAGVAGVLKLVLALEHEEIPRHLHCDEPSPHIDWGSMPIAVATSGQAWPRADRPRRAAASAFGFSGTNAHVILEEAPVPAAGTVRPAAPPAPTAEVLTLSATDEPALRELVARFADHLDDAQPVLGDLAWTVQTGRARFAHRLATIARSPDEASSRLRSWLAGEEPPGVVRAESAASPQLAFVFTGHGAQYPTMGQELYEHEPVFRTAMDECDRLLQPHLKPSLLDVLYGRDEQVGALVHHTEFAEPAVFAVEYALAQLWRSWGIEPSAVVGHSIGEYAAACVAGVLSLDDAIHLVAARGKLIGDLPGGGATSAVFEDEAPALTAPMLEVFSALAASVTYREPILPFVSAMTGEMERLAIADAAYWVDHVTAKVRFDDAASVLLAAGIDHFVEIGPHSTMLDVIGRLGGRPQGLHPSFRSGRDDSELMAEALGALWAAGCEPDWSEVHQQPVARVAAPTYTFQRQRYWFESGRESRLPVLGGRTAEPELGPDDPGYLDHHRSLALALESATLERPVHGAPSPHRADMLDVGRAGNPRADGRSRLPEVSPPPSRPVASLTSIPLASRAEPIPASPAQRRFLFMADFEPTAAVYNISGAVRISGDLDLGALEAAFSGVVRRHESLRTNFELIDDELFQIIEKPQAVFVEQRDLRSTPADEIDLVLAEEINAEAARPFDVHHDVKLRGLLLRTGTDVHVLVTTTHHIAADGWSAGRLVREIEELYAAAVNGMPPQLPDLPIQYADYAVWEREQLALPALQSQLSYWGAQLAGNLPALSLPTDRPRPPMRTHHGASVAFTVPPELLAAVKASSREAGVTPFMMLLASYMATLTRHAGQDEIVVGTVSANRSRSQVADLIGPFVNTLAVRVGVDPGATFTALLDQVRRTAIEAYAHQDVPFDRVVEAVSPPRDLSRSPIFQTMLILQNVPIPDLHLGTLDIEAIPTRAKAVDVDLALELLDRPSGMTGELKFNTDLFEKATIERLVGHWLTLLASAAADRDLAVGDLPLLSAQERAELKLAWPGPVVPVDDRVAVPTLVERQVASTPDRLAVRFGHESVTYECLNARANQLAHHLIAVGVTRGDLVGVHLERSVDLIVAVLAVLKAGAAYVPLDPGLPAGRLAYMLDHTAVSVVISREAAVAPLDDADHPDGAIRVLLDRDHDRIARCSVDNPSVAVSGHDRCHVIYTSGSTGRPKGVEVEHRSVVSFLQAMAARLGTGAEDVVLGSTTLSFDPSVLELFLPLMQGAQIVVADRETTTDPVALAALLHTSGVTIMQATPTTWRMLVDDGWTGEPDLTVLYGGEAMPPDLVKAMLARCRSLWNLYGPTETTVWTTVHRVAPDADVQRGSVPVGTPIANARCYVLDANLQPVPMGVPGELFIGGIGVARGYLNQPELTAERFLHDPFASVPDGRMYRTGDLARLLPDGTLDLLGRADHQVKIRGHRIELGEIEHTLASHPRVRAAVVTTYEPTPRDVHLVAYYIPDREDPAEPGELRDHLRAMLPGPMIPSVYVPLSEFPLTSSNKVDRNRLPRPPAVVATGDGPRRGPQNQLQAQLVDIWAGVLGQPDLGIDDDFFDLGGHSLLATQIVSRVRAGVGVEVPLRALFDHPTVAGMAEQIGSVDAGSRSELLSPQIVPVDRDLPLPLSASQERMRFMYELHPDSAAYNMAGAIRLRGTLDVPALAGAFDDLVARHESLRTTFPVVDGDPVQRIAPHASIEMEVFDRRSVPASERMAVVAEETRAASRRPFRLEELPLVRCALYILDDDEHVLYSNMHHIIGDQWSFGVLSRDLTACYNARLAGQDSQLAPLAVHFGDYVQWHRDWIASGAIDTQLDYWRHQLAACPTIDLPADRPRPPIQTASGATLLVPLPDHIRRGIDELCLRCRVSPFMVLLAALDVVLHRHTGADDIVVGTAIANRNWLESEDLIGTFVNTLVLRTDLSGAPTFAELLERVQRVALDAYANQDVPFATVVNALQPDRDLSRSALFQVFLNVQNAPFEVPRLDGIAAELITVDRGAAQFDVSLSVDLAVRKDVLIEFNPDLFDAERIERLVAHLLTLLEAAAADPSVRIGEVGMLPERERGELQGLWSGPTVPVESGVGVHTLVERQADVAADRLAVHDGRQSLTYGELNARANRLARHLVGLGVAGGDLVGVCLNRSADMVVAVLAVLKAGAGYVPLDPAFPSSRLGFMLSDSGAAVMITRSGVIALEDGSSTRRVLLDVDAADIDREDDTDLFVDVSDTDLAYVIYTSGSTGLPKGVQVEHGNVINFLQAMSTRPGITRDDIVVSVTTLSFDISVLELFLPLVHGAQVVIADQDTTVDAAALARLLDTSGASMMQATPTTWRMLVDDGWAGRSGLTALCGGEPMPPELAELLLARGLELWNMYGPTETTVWSTVHRVEQADLGTGSVPIGVPIDNTECYVLDARLQPLPLGVPGELVIGGTGVARGYLNRPELTSERFVPDPFSSVVGARMYRTGDLVVWRADGLLEHQGRLDHQVKVRGHRIELGEIEHGLVSHPGVSAAVVTTWEPSPGDVRLVGYYLPVDGEIDADVLRDHLRVGLPGYMVPAVYVPMEAFPLTPNNKIDRKQLPAPTVTARVRSRRRPQDPVQAQLVDIWAEVLGQPDLGIDDDFFDMGGHSLLATRMFPAMEKVTGQKLPLSALFQAPTIAGLTELLAEDPQAPRWTSLIAMQPEGPRPPFFYVSPYLITILSFTYLARYMQPDQPFYVLQPQGMEGEHPVHHRVEDMADHYIAEMRQVQPFGPYRLGGHCAGSSVAFEMARQLQASGEEVELLVVVDSEPPNIAPPRVNTLRHVVGRLWQYLRDGQLVDSVRWQLGLIRDRHIVRHFGAGENQRVAALRHAHSEAHRSYQGGLFDGDLMLIRSEDWASRPEKDWHLRWNELVTGEVLVDTVAGSHGDLVENATSAELATKIRSAIDSVAHSAWVPLVIGFALAS